MLEKLRNPRLASLLNIGNSSGKETYSASGVPQPGVLSRTSCRRRPTSEGIFGLVVAEVGVAIHSSCVGNLPRLGVAARCET
ncbi:hypothetical protein [Paracoccus sp. DMF]|uniref:hypothetical protein n=1 Tax=Paracoccus sp. DMF TaxID=400837 RepID=UPI0011034F38|nr:hypothetical protein [Paracoccus sp. DMF]MCV2446098.1 hypothetical protein [Paracoccus sp. DMF]